MIFFRILFLRFFITLTIFFDKYLELEEDFHKRYVIITPLFNYIIIYIFLSDIFLQICPFYHVLLTDYEFSF